MDRSNDTVVSHIKRIDRTTGITKIMTVLEVVDEMGMESRMNLQKWGKFMTTRHIYHVIDTYHALIEIIGKQVLFSMKDGSEHLIKVQAIGFMGVISGFDDERMNMVIYLDQVDEYYMPGMVKLP